MKTSAETVRAAIYLRVSTSDQVDNTSLAEQRLVCEAAIAGHPGWVVAEVYADEGLSGTSDERPAWRRMLADAQAGTVGAVVVAKLDRFARNAGHAIAETDRLQALGIPLLIVKEQIDMSTPQGRLMRTMLAGFAEMERDVIVSRTVGGQRAKATNGDWPGGKPPFGWRLQDVGRNARPVPDERERHVIGLVYDLLVRKHLTAGQVADRLNDAGMLTRSAQENLERGRAGGAHWDPQVLRRTFANDVLYTGKTIWGAVESGSMYKRSHHTKLDRHGKPLYGDPIELQLVDPPLTRRQHLALIREFARRSTRGQSRPEVKQMLATRLKGECGEVYYGVSTAGKDYDVYRCSGRKHLKGKDKCSCVQVQVQDLDARVWAQVEQLLGDPNRLESLARQWLEVPADATVSGTADAVSGIDRQIEKWERALGRASREILLADDPEPLRQAVSGLSKELADLRERKAAYALLLASETAKAQSLTDIVQLAERAKGRLRGMDREQRREVIEILGIEVQMAGPYAASRPDHVHIAGRFDARLFTPADGETENGGP
ncbi:MULTISPECIES: recombinase family protein [unclassified Frondihabitans]|uniref:recombinase family protein n=1 Tax=unclassified Frondihabitans TaxID=2626248 RepID=UPI000F506001|nr:MULTISPECIES: recombinase family protein [unclassified Frondihabitans]RPE78953.1 DNA invertase Pin-like site-specific DNA recombinase [Frondihabitans sp. PhB153]RPF09234.1 DNA invertase Pin-like site-specific DNA recombinase [Frondihabitans sp. PhB161]